MNARLPINLMLVEDERIVAFDLKRQLQGFGYNVSAVVASGEQAVSHVAGQIAENKPDLVLMDIHLEGRMDGIDAALEIRAKHQIPVVYLTAYAEDDTLRRALESRPFGYLIKPCEGRALHATIQMALARREDEAAVEQSEERLQLALDAGALGVFEWSPTTNRLQGDMHLGMLFGNQLLPFDEAWEAFIARVDTNDRERLHAALNATLVGAEAVQFEFRTLDDAAPRFMEAHVKAYGSAGEVRRVVGILHDVTQRHQDAEALRQSSVVFQATADAIVISDVERRVVAVNGAFSRFTGYTEAEVIGRDLDTLLHINPGTDDIATSLLAGTGFWHGEVRCYRKNGEAFPAWESVSTVRNGAGSVTHFVMAFSDVTAIYDAQQQLHHLAHHDPLTGLPNRLLFHDRLKTAIDLAQRNKRRCLLLYLDLDGFKTINDTLGHAIGDELLRTVAGRVTSVLRSSDTVARLGGDEFVILAGSTNTDYAAQLAEKILEKLRLPVTVANQTLNISGSLGIAFFPDNGDDSHELVRAADMAMYTAKAAGRNRYHFYSEEMSARAKDRMDIEQGLRRAIASDALVVHYQPRVDLAARRIVGVEALVRWQHPERGIIYPDSFISVAEECGIIEHLGCWVLRKACREMLDFVHSKAGGDGFHMAVNVSPRQFLSPDFVEFVKTTLEETGFPAASLELEITESTLQATERSLTILKALARLGVSISLDDFGTGYSSLSVLRDLPINRVKIDRSFIVDLPASESQCSVVEAIVTLSRAMHMSITVEGVERAEQADVLQQLGCHEGQGFFFAHALPFANFVHLFRAGQAPILPTVLPGTID